MRVRYSPSVRFLLREEKDASNRAAGKKPAANVWDEVLFIWNTLHICRLSPHSQCHTRGHSQWVTVSRSDCEALALSLSATDTESFPVSV